MHTAALARARARRRVVLRGDRGRARRTSSRCVASCRERRLRGRQRHRSRTSSRRSTLADEASDAARAIGAANTLSFARRRDRAENTDAAGLPRRAPASRRRAGGPSCSAPAARRARSPGRCARRAPRSSIRNRTAPRGRGAGGRARRVGARARATSDSAAGSFDLLVNATIGRACERRPTLEGGCGPKGAAVSMPMRWASTPVVVDLVYGPRRDGARRARARARGATVVDGLEVLVRQGAASLRIWTGLEPPLETMRRAAESQIDECMRPPRTT